MAALVEIVIPVMGIFAGPGGWEPGKALKPAVRLSEPGARALESAERAMEPAGRALV